MSRRAGSYTATLLPNLGAEEGDDWQAVPNEPSALSAAALWALLFSKDASFTHPAPGSARVAAATKPAGPPSTQAWLARPCADLWPEALGPAQAAPVWPWLEAEGRPVAWLNTPSLDAQSQALWATGLAGPRAEDVIAVHDKAFAIEGARELDLLPRALAPLVQILEPEALKNPGELIPRLERALASWPAFTGGRYTLKPRFGTSGRGRVGGAGSLDRDAVRGALPRFAARGGAIFEPWLERTIDLSVALRIPGPESPNEMPTLLGSLEMIVTRSGVFRGHCGEVDNRARVFSGHALDETLRADAAGIAGLARARGFFGPCGVDSFCYAERQVERDRERLRSGVEFNARSTMGLVTIGLVRRSLGRVREALELTPGARRAFLFTMLRDDLDAGAETRRDQLLGAIGQDAIAFDLAPPSSTFAAVETTASARILPRPFLFYARDRQALRQAHRDVMGC